MAEQTIVHLLRHGEVHNPGGILYGRRDGFHLSELGHRMAQRIADTIGDRDIVHMRTSPLERAQETAAPLAKVRELTPVIDPRVIESANKFEGVNFGGGAKTFPQAPPAAAPHVQPPHAVVGRALRRDRRADGRRDPRRARRGPRSRGRGRVHQLPIWTTRLFTRMRSYLHHPKSRQCTLCSLTSVVFDGDAVVPGALLRARRRPHPAADRSAPFSAGGAAAGTVREAAAVPRCCCLPAHARRVLRHVGHRRHGLHLRGGRPGRGEGGRPRRAGRAHR